MTQPTTQPTGEPQAEGRAEHRFRFLAPLLFGLLALLAGLFAYWAADTTPPIENISGKVVSTEVYPDGSAKVIVEWMAIRRRICHGNSIRWIIDGYITPLPDIEYPPPHPGEVGQVVKWRVPVPVPKDFHSEGVYRVHIVYECNLLNRLFPIVIDPPDVPFRIDRPAPAP